MISNKTIVLVLTIFTFCACTEPKNAKKEITSDKDSTIKVENVVADKTSNLTVAQFNALAASQTIVIIDFNAVWCGPCKRLSPMLEQLKKEYGNKIKVVKIDVDENETLSQHFQISSIPLLHFYKNGKLVNQLSGLPDKKELKMQIEILVK